MRNSIKPPLNRITQGSIFSCVKSPYSEGKACYGISITARCDTARNFKAPSLTFLPLVTMEDWLWHDALPRCINEQKKSAESSLRKHLVHKDGSSIVLDTYGIEAGFSAADPKDKGTIKQNERYKEAQKAEKVAPYKWKDLPSSISTSMIAEAEKLIKGSNQNYYFIDSVEPSFGEKPKSFGCGFVAILREVRAISRELALQLLEGIDHDKIHELQKTDPTAFQLSIDKDSFCIPTGELGSPFIEQLMQNFSLLFGRVGTADVPSAYAMEIEKLLGSKA
jgi:hypothetical protein